MSHQPSRQRLEATVYEIGVNVALGGDQLAAIYAELNDAAPPVEIRWAAHDQSMMSFESAMDLAVLTDRVHATLASVLGASWLDVFQRLDAGPIGAGAALVD
jgi:hypothetical protein